jgi:hypothetical protein
MQRLNRLTVRAIATLKKPGRHADGGGLYLKIDKSGAKRWTFMWMRARRQREAGLGSIKAVTLAKAREIAAGMRANYKEIASVRIALQRLLQSAERNRGGAHISVVDSA